MSLLMRESKRANKRARVSQPDADADLIATKVLKRQILDSAADKIIELRGNCNAGRLGDGVMVKIVADVQKVCPSISRAALLGHTKRKQRQQEKEAAEALLAVSPSPNTPNSDPIGTTNANKNAAGAKEKAVLNAASKAYAAARKEAEKQGRPKLGRGEVSKIIKKTNEMYGTNSKINPNTLKKRFASGNLEGRGNKGASGIMVYVLVETKDKGGHCNESEVTCDSNVVGVYLRMDDAKTAMQKRASRFKRSHDGANYSNGKSGQITHYKIHRRRIR